MSDRYYATLTIRQADFARRDVEQAIRDYFGDPEQLPVEVETEARIIFSDEFACNGEFYGLEQELVALGVPFERHSSAYDEYTAETRYFQPGRWDKTVCEIDGEPFIAWSELERAVEEGLEAVRQLWRDRQAPPSLFDESAEPSA